MFAGDASDVAQRRRHANRQSSSSKQQTERFSHHVSKGFRFRTQLVQFVCMRIGRCRRRQGRAWTASNGEWQRIVHGDGRVKLDADDERTCRQIDRYIVQQ